MSQPCLACGYLLEESTALSNLTKADPEDGDISICLACGVLAVFEDGPLGLRRRLATPAEQDELREDPDIRRALAVRAARIGDSLLVPPAALCGKQGARFDGAAATGSCVFPPHESGPHSWS